MSDENDGWTPEDGAGYMPTEERANPHEQEKACGNYHPLPCGLDVECEFLTLLEQLEQEAQDVEDGKRPRMTEAYANGVCAGIRYARDELEELLNG